MATIPADVQKRTIFEQEFKSVVETKNVFSPVATKLISTAKNILSPFTSVTDAKAHTQTCKVPLGTLTIGNDELVLDRRVGNSLTDCEEELSYAAFDLQGMIRRDLYASVMKRANELAVTDFVADATSGGAISLTTGDEVRNWLIGVAADAEANTVGLQQRIDGARTMRAEKHGQPFVAAGRDAFVRIVSQVASIVGQSSLRGLDGGNMVETPYGVTIINLGSSADAVNRIIWGVAGVPTIAYREDKIDVGMGEMTSTTTYSGYTDLDLEDGDPLLARTWYIYAQTLGRNGIFSNVQSLVSAGTATLA